MDNIVTWNGSNVDEVNNLIGVVNNHKDSKHGFYEDKVIIKTDKGWKQVDPGDSIAKDHEGNLYIV